MSTTTRERKPLTIQGLIRQLQQALDDAPHEARAFPIIVNTLMGPVAINSVKVDVLAQAVWLDGSDD